MQLQKEYVKSLNDDEIKLIAAKNYKNGTTMQQFNEDWTRVSYIRKLLGRRRNSGKFNPRLFLNHIVVLNNIFGPRVTAFIMFSKTEERDWSVVKSALLVLSYMSLEEMSDVEPDIEAWKEFKYQ